MPYVTPAIRRALDYDEREALTPGELNYEITQLALGYLGTSPDYRKYNDVIGVLESCKLELYRRAVAPYEDTKIEENGDVYT